MDLRRHESRPRSKHHLSHRPRPRRRRVHPRSPPVSGPVVRAHDRTRPHRLPTCGPRFRARTADTHRLRARAPHRRSRSQRWRDRLAALAYGPPRWVVDAVGERPTDPRRRREWDAIVDTAGRFRFEHGVADDVEGLLGPPPRERDPVLWARWALTRRQLDARLQALREPGPGRAVGL